MLAHISTPSVLLEGPSGTGKTYSIPTLVEAGLDVFVMITEPNGLDTLLDSMERRKLSIDRLHWKIIAPRKAGLTQLLASAKKINELTFKELSNLSGGMSKAQCRQFSEFLMACQNFHCDRTNQSYGDVTTWDANRAFVIDSNSGLNTMVTQNTVGLRPLIQLAEYGVIQNTLRQLIEEFTNMDAFFVLIAHVEKQISEHTGAVTIMTKSVGKQLSPDIPTFFSEAILARRARDQFFWSTADEGVDSKNRALPIADDLEPNFVPIVQRYRERVEFVSPSEIKEERQKTRDAIEECKDLPH